MKAALAITLAVLITAYLLAEVRKGMRARRHGRVLDPFWPWFVRAGFQLEDRLMRRPGR